MTRALATLGLVVFLAPVVGCGPSLESKLIGRWRLDTQSIDLQKAAEEQIKQQTEGNEAAAAMAQAFSGMMKTMLESLQVDIEFRPDHTVQSRAAVSVFGQKQEKTQSGTWKVEAVGDNQLTVSVAMDGGETNTINVKFLDDNTFTAVGNVPGAGDQQAKFQRIVEGA